MILSLPLFSRLAARLPWAGADGLPFFSLVSPKSRVATTAALLLQIRAGPPHSPCGRPFFFGDLGYPGDTLLWFPRTDRIGRPSSSCPLSFRGALVPANDQPSVVEESLLD